MKSFIITPNSIHTSEAYFKNFCLTSDNIIIPFINFGIIKHNELNPTNKLNFIDRCYLVCSNIELLKINNLFMINMDSNLETYYFGGEDLNKSELIEEFEIKAKNIKIILLEDSKISEKQFIPIKTPNFEPNMDQNSIDKFLSGITILLGKKGLHEI
jgi:hypothetical protein